METTPFVKAKAFAGHLIEWAKKNGSFRMVGTHQLVVLFTKEYGKAQEDGSKLEYLVCEDPESNEKFIIPSGQFTLLQEKHESVAILIDAGDGKVTLNSKLPYAMNEDGGLYLDN